MLKLKKTAVAVLAFGSSAVFAGTMGPVCSPGNVTVPCERSAWDFAGQALYLQPSLGYLNAVGYTPSTTSTGGTFNSYRNVGHKWGWGFKLEASYHFGTGNDLDLNWYHLGNSKKRVITGPLFGPAEEVYTGTGGISLNMDPKWDMANLELAQHVDFSQVSSVRFHGGISYSRVANKTTLSSATSTTSSSATFQTTYNGFGPRVGADAMYGFGNGLSFYANSGLGMYAGTQSSSTTVVSAAGVSSGSSFSVMRIVPELEAKLGGSYTYSMAQGDLSLDAGWMWINYFDVVSRSGFAPNAAGQSTSFGLQGPFVGLKWVGNVV